MLLLDPNMASDPANGLHWLSSPSAQSGSGCHLLLHPIVKNERVLKHH